MSDKTPFATVLKALTNPAANFPPRYLPEFSDLEPTDLAALLKAWPQVDVRRKRNLLRDLNELFRADTLYSFEDMAVALMDDPDALVRAQALRLLEETQDTRLLSRLLKFAAQDPDIGVRTAAVTALGQFVHLGELEEISAAQKQQVENLLLKTAREETNAHLQRAAIESLGYSTLPEVNELIEAAFNHRDSQRVASALIAMLRSADGALWQAQILVSLEHEDAQVRLAAAQAAGELDIKSARVKMLAMLDEEEDDDVLQALIWSLSQIGGEDVRDYLETLLDAAEDEDTIAFLEEALTNLSFTEDSEKFGLLAVDPDDELVELDDLDDETDEAEDEGR